MVRTAIVVPDGSVLPEAITSAHLFFENANAYRQMHKKDLVFEVSLLGRKAVHWVDGGPFGIRTLPINREQKYDLVIIPGFTSQELPLAQNLWLIDWLRYQYEVQGAEIASMCTGAFLMAEAGILDGKKCTTHWAFQDQFHSRFRNIRLEVDRLVTDVDGTYSSAGAFSSLNLLLYLVEKFADKATALWLAKVFQVDVQRDSQKPFMILNQLMDHQDSQIKEVQTYIESHYGQSLTIPILATRFAFSERNILRRFKLATGITIRDYIQQVRTEAAKRLLEDSRCTINQIINKVGYQDGATFRKMFKKITGVSPSDYRRQYASIQQNLKAL